MGIGGLDELQGKWKAAWPAALEVWSRFTKLTDPRWCLTPAEEKAEDLTASFAMIRLTDHAVVISLRQVAANKLEDFAVEVLAHEIGHHVFAPGDLRDNARLLARVRAGLPTREQLAGYVSNLYTDLLINDRLERAEELNMAGVYQALSVPGGDPIWHLYMRIYEYLWRLPAGTLVKGKLDKRIESDAGLGARVIRNYAKDWLDGAGRFAALLLPYLLKIPEDKFILVSSPWFDTRDAGLGDEVPDGMVEVEDGELEGAIHPASDPDLSGIEEESDEDEEKKGRKKPRAGGRETIGGKKNNYRSPTEYTELMKSLGVKVSEKDLIVRYYRERALPHLVRFPVRLAVEAADPLPEGLDGWEAGDPLSELDWVETAVQSPYVIPGVTTVRRTYGTADGGEPEKIPLDLYLGVDCSGSMGNPAYSMSYPILAGTIIVLSALRAGARVQTCLSGEPGEYSATEGFIRDEKKIMTTLTGYLGTGYAFGINRLKGHILDGGPFKRPVHLMIVTDQDIFHMLGEVKDGWEMARAALEKAGGGGTYVLNIASDGYYRKDIDRMKADGWNVHLVASWEEMVAFARAFAKTNYEKTREGRR